MSGERAGQRSPAWPSVGRRVAARLLDGLIWAVPTAFVVNPSPGDAPGTSPRSPGLGTAIYVAALVYEVVLTWRFGQTVGKRALRVRVEDLVSGASPTLLQSVARVVVVTALPVALIGNRLSPDTAMFLDVTCALILLGSVMARPDRRGLHDLAARTRVVSAE